MDILRIVFFGALLLAVGFLYYETYQMMKTKQEYDSEVYKLKKRINELEIARNKKMYELSKKLDKHLDKIIKKSNDKINSK